LRLQCLRIVEDEDFTIVNNNTSEMAHHSTQVSSDLIWEIARMFALSRDPQVEEKMAWHGKGEKLCSWTENWHCRKPELLPREARSVWRCPILSRSSQLGQRPLPQGMIFGQWIRDAKANLFTECRFRQRQGAHNSRIRRMGITGRY
jgi:hypothetical protein